MTQTTLPGNPFVGPVPFDQNTRQYFYGRDEEIAILEGLVMARRAVLLFAQSGAGKSSLVQAGLIPELTMQRDIGRGPAAVAYHKMRVLPILRVGGTIPSGLADSIANAYVFTSLLSLTPAAAPADLAALSLADGLAPLLTMAREGEERLESDLETNPDTLIIFDQFEELFTYYPERWRDREGFFHQVTEALEAYPDLHVLFTMREDYIAELTPYANLLPDQLRSRFRLERLQREAALQAVTQPAARAGIPFGDGVAEGLVDNLRRIQAGRSQQNGSKVQASYGTYVEPVHLQIVCRQLWDKLPPGCSVIGAQDVQEFGDVDQALIGFYEGSLDRVLQSEGASLSPRRLRAWFDQELITPAGTRGLVYQGADDTQGMPNSAVRILENAYLIRAEIRGNDKYYELAHDRLVQPVLQANQRWRQAYKNPLEVATWAWLQAGRSPDKLLDGAQLQEALAYAQDNPLDVLREEEEFLEESQRSEVARTEKARQQARLRRSLLASAAVVVVLLTALTLWSLSQRAAADRAKATAVAAGATAEAEAQRAEAAAATAVVAQGEAEVNLQKAEAAQSTAVAEAQRAETEARRAEAEARIARSNLLAMESDRQFKGPRYDQALLLAIEAGRTEHTIAAHNALHQALVTPVRTLHLLIHGRPILHVAWSPDEDRVLTTSADDTARVWNVETGEELLRLPHDGNVVYGEWSPDGSRIVTASEDGTARIWDSESGEEVQRLELEDAVRYATWSRNGRRVLTASNDGTAAVWDAQTGQELVTIEQEDTILQAIWNGDESRIATASEDGTAQVWDSESGELVLVLSHQAAVWGVTWSRDGSRILTASGDGTATVWDASTGEVLVTVGHDSGIVQATWDPREERIATASDDGTAAIWDAQTGEQLHELEHNGSLYQAVWSPDGDYLLTASDDGTARVWDAASGQEELRLVHDGLVQRVAWAKDQPLVLTASADGMARIWELDPDPGLVVVPREGVDILSGSDPAGGRITVRWSGDGMRVLTASLDGKARVWEANSGQEQLVLRHTDIVLQAIWSRDESQILTTSADGTARVWDGTSGRELLRLDHDDWVRQATWNRDETLIATACDDGTARVWDARTGEVLLAMSHGSGAPVYVANWSPDGQRLLTSSEDGTAQVWDAQTGRQLLVLDNDPGAEGNAVDEAVWSPDGRFILTPSWNNKVIIWDSTSGMPVHTMTHDSYALRAGWNRDGSKVLSTSADFTARLWDANSGSELLRVRHDDFVRQAIFNQDETQILTTSDDQTARVWDAGTGQELLRMSLGDWASRAAWSPSESRIVVADRNGQAVVFYIDLDELLVRACQYATRNLLRSEWARFMSDEPYRATCPELPIEPAPAGGAQAQTDVAPAAGETPPPAAIAQLPADTPAPAATATPRPEPTDTPTPQATATAQATDTETPTSQPTNTPTQEPTVTPTAEPTTTATEAATEEPTPEPVPLLRGRLVFPVFDSSQSTYNLYIANADGSGLELLLDRASQPEISRDGQRIAYRRWAGEDRGLGAMSISGGNRQRITSFLEDALPSWSPNGQSLVFFSRREGDRNSRIYLANAAGGDQEFKPGGQPLFGEYPTWGANGRILLRSTGAQVGLAAMNSDGSGLGIVLGDGSATAPALSPNGSLVVFMSQRDGNWEIYRMNADGSGLSRLTSQAGSDGLPTWSPDGRSIAWASDRSGRWALWAMNADGSNQRQLLALPGSLNGSISGEPEYNNRGWVEERISWGP